MASLMERDAASIQTGRMVSTPCLCTSKVCTCGPMEVGEVKIVSDAGIVPVIDVASKPAPMVETIKIFYRCYCRETTKERCQCRACKMPCIAVRRVMAIEHKVQGSNKPTAYKCGCLNGLLITYKWTKKPCDTCGQSFQLAERPYADATTRRGLKLEHDHSKGKDSCKACLAERERDAHNNAASSPVLNERLVCVDDKLTDGFSRTIATRYLSKRMVYAPRGVAKGKEAAPKTVRERKTSSAKHSPPMYLASDVEDIIQDAFVIYLTESTPTKWKYKRVGNRMQDTCNACRIAYTLFRRERHKSKLDGSPVDYYADLEARGHTSGRVSDRSRENAHYDDELEQLLVAAREHGIDNQKELAEALGLSQMQLSRQLEKLRQRIKF